MIEEVGLEETRAKWKQLKTEMDNNFRRIERISPEVAKAMKRNLDETIETIEVDLLYPDRKKNKENSAWIWVLVVVVVIAVIGVIAYFWYRKSKTKK